MNPQSQNDTPNTAQPEPIASPRPVAPWTQQPPSTVIQPQPTQSAASPAPTPIQPQPATSTAAASETVQVPVQVIQPAAATPSTQQVPSEPQPQPDAAPLPLSEQPVSVRPTSNSKARRLALAGVVVIVLAAGAFSAFTFLSKSPEAKVGSDYLKAVQAKDYAAVEKLINPEVTKLGNKIGQAGGEEAKTGFYEQLLQSTGDTKIADSKNVESPRVTKTSSDDGTKYAYVSYKVGSKTATALETYDSNGNPRILALESGVKYYPASKFKQDYKVYKDQMTSMGSLIDKIAASSGSQGKQTIKSMFTAEN